MSRSEHDDIVQGEIDGVASAAEKARLEELLASRPDVGESLASLRGVSETLARAERLEPPPGLADDVMRSVRARALSRARGGWREALRPLFTPVPLAACAAALVFGFALGAFLPEEARFPGSDHEALSGTALPRGRVASPVTLDRKAIAGEGLRGEAATRLENGGFVLTLDLDGGRPLEVSVDLAGTGLEPRSFERNGAAGGDVAMTAGAVRFTHPAGRGRYRLSFAGAGPAGRELRLRLGGEEPLVLALGREAPR